MNGPPFGQVFAMHQDFLRGNPLFADRDALRNEIGRLKLEIPLESEIRESLKPGKIGEIGREGSIDQNHAAAFQRGQSGTRPLRAGEDGRIGQAGERLGIAARGVGSMWRLIEEATAWALAREQGGQRIMDYQGVSFPLADSAADAAAGRALTLEVARLADDGADPKIVHAKASMAKLFVSEAANRCADRCLQIFGGRGYMRTNVAERFFRELRVDKIWEGTSEIQRLIIARALERRGVERTLH